MLVLGRRQNEAIIIAGNIRILVVESVGKVRLGIEAPAEVTVDREEIHLSKQADRARNRANDDPPRLGNL